MLFLLASLAAAQSPSVVASTLVVDHCDTTPIAFDEVRSLRELQRQVGRTANISHRLGVRRIGVGEEKNPNMGVVDKIDDEVVFGVPVHVRLFNDGQDLSIETLDPEDGVIDTYIATDAAPGLYFLHAGPALSPSCDGSSTVVVQLGGRHLPFSRRMRRQLRKQSGTTDRQRVRQTRGE